MLSLSEPITKLPMIGPLWAKRLKKLKIVTLGDLLFHFPFRYEDFSQKKKIADLKSGEKATVIGKIVSFQNLRTKYGKNLQKALIADETGEMEAIWYNQPFLAKIFSPEKKVALAGEVKGWNKFFFESPQYEVCGKNQKKEERLIHTGRLVPVYSETEEVSSKWLRGKISLLLHKLPLKIDEFLPFSLRLQFNLLEERQALYQIHFPKNSWEIAKAKKRLSFDELLDLFLAAYLRRQQWEKAPVGFLLQLEKHQKKIKSFISHLPFSLTSAQEKAVKEILNDLSKEKPMNRLLEGDVGSGKTVVAAIAFYAVFLNGYQGALMAPTEILAKQHYQTITHLLSPFKVKVGLLTGSVKEKEEDYDLFVGTHALLSENFSPPRLALVVIDEQQRFGVEQRAKLRGKGLNPHVLTMTATPIPRTIALTLYADLDLSVLDELPPGRQKVKTWVVPPEKRPAAYEWIRKKIRSTSPPQQVFIVCPLIEESENLETAKAATVEYERLKKEIFPDFSLGLLHGRLTPSEKTQIIKNFRQGKLDILVTTPVVEVGIDIPQATIMLIEGAERFGLAQLHQLRGRVGRGNLPSFCLLFSDSTSPTILARLKILEKVFSGPKLAEFDLSLRGAGEIFGTRQHGKIELKIADLADISLVKEAKKAAQILCQKSPDLSLFPLLKERVQKYTIRDVAPD